MVWYFIFITVVLGKQPDFMILNKMCICSESQWWQQVYFSMMDLIQSLFKYIENFIDFQGF